MGFLRMVLMMVNLFTLIRYAAGMEATRNITPGLEPEDDKGWDKLDIERCVSQPGIYLFFMIWGNWVHRLPLGWLLSTNGNMCTIS